MKKLVKNLALVPFSGTVVSSKSTHYVIFLNLIDLSC